MYVLSISSTSNYPYMPSLPLELADLLPSLLVLASLDIERDGDYGD